MPFPFLDTNILLYTLDHGDPRRPIARAILGRGGIISTQVLNEFVNVAQRKLKLSWLETTTALKQLRDLCRPCLPLTVATHESAITVAERYGLAFYDALIVASALEAGCNTLLTEDMNNVQRIDGRLTIRNPFVP